MNPKIRSTAVLVALVAGFACMQLIGAPARAQDGDAPGEDAANAQAMAEMMAKAQKYTQPSEHHAFLEKMLGEWDTELRLTMQGMESDPEKGKATFSWIMDGRWMKQESTGSMMGMPLQTFSLFGYDNFKQSYVVTSVSSFDTAMVRAEGDVDPRTGALLLYGTLDEYLTGEHDKMVKTVWRFPSENEMIMEVHDLPIGETGTQVFQVRYTR